MAVDLFQAVWSHSAVSVAGRSIDLGDGTRLPDGHKAVCAHRKQARALVLHAYARRTNQ
jgi:hypothetical protein